MWSRNTFSEGRILSSATHGFWTCAGIIKLFDCRANHSPPEMLQFYTDRGRRNAGGSEGNCHGTSIALVYSIQMIEICQMSETLTHSFSLCYIWLYGTTVGNVANEWAGWFYGNSGFIWFLHQCNKVLISHLKRCTPLVLHMMFSFLNMKSATQSVFFVLWLWREFSKVWKNNHDDVTVMSSGLCQLLKRKSG